ncbi:hypothetical protein BDM02DRAFT_1850844 [Thelephora ganbajun]|uniref:Uncharacterized protein n=1 Tax=Thelephora ganbajun TaxID=370292 RepID=A0ACB6ZIY1_THEGA|nr:hypothetical protein BDM02DRAFT_1850844 [Thelephora ganbajun]
MKLREHCKDVEQKILDLRHQLNRFKQNLPMTTIDGDPEETGRRKELTRYVGRPVASLALLNDFHSTLGEIEKRSQVLLAKYAVAWSTDRDEDFEEVAGLVKRLREAVSHYQVSGCRIIAPSAVDMEEQVSQQRTIYDKITNLTVRFPDLPKPTDLIVDSPVKLSFDAILELHEVVRCNEYITVQADTGTEIPYGEEQARFDYGANRRTVLKGG